MHIQKVATIFHGQDGAIWGNYLFRFEHSGDAHVYDLSQLCPEKVVNLEAIATFRLDKSEQIVPHSNAVMFGTEYYAPEDEFPLLYSNIYNNYAEASHPLTGVCCVYRLQRQGMTFTSTLVQLIEIGFTEDSRYWRSDNATRDVRPYGNFTIDRESGTYYAFTMRDRTETTRYFAFRLPRVCAGIPDAQFGVNKVILTQADILDYFDCDYHHFIQGACCHGGKIYSVEGFSHDPVEVPALRIIDPKLRKQLRYFRFPEAGLQDEAELIDFYGEKCLYADETGNLYLLEL
jgi:hypothetical protein